MATRTPMQRRKKKPKLKPKPTAEWTVMVYLAGDNNLSAECVWALTEMQSGMSLDNINVIAQFDPSDGLARTRRYEITSKGVKTVERHQEERYKPKVKPIEERPQVELEAFATDHAGWNPVTGEAQFDNESRKASALARRRHETIRARARFEQQIIDNGQPLNAELPPDEFGESLNDTDAASPVTLYNFLSFGIKFYPARHYMIVISGHSAGIEPSYLLRDDSSGDYMTFRQLGVVFDQLKDDLEDPSFDDGRASTIDILGFDTCLMSMTEICSGLQKHVDIVIGSETYTPSSGWPYRTILSALEAATLQSSQPNGKTDPYAIARMVVDKYVEFYKNYVTAGVSVALSALNVKKAPALSPGVKKLTNVLISELEAEHPEIFGKREKKRRPFTDALILAHWDAQSYNGEWYVDLIDFCECLIRRYPKRTIVNPCKELIAFLNGQDDSKPSDKTKDNNKFVIHSAFSGPTCQHSHGVAVYFPWSTVASYFWAFDFATASGWGNFLAYYTNLTRRKFRATPEARQANPERIKELEEFGGNFLNYATNISRSEERRV